MVTVKYNSVDILDGIGIVSTIERGLTPLAYPDTWGFSDVFTLNGVLTGNCLPTVSSFLTSQATLRSRLSQDFKTFSIEEDSSEVFSSDNALIKSIDFPQSPYLGTVPFSVVIQTFPTDYWKGTYGVQNPSNAYDYAENTDGTLKLVRTISCRGFNTSPTTNNALSNAKSFVSSLTGDVTGIMPLFINNDNIKPGNCLQTIAESVNRLDGSYSVTLTWLWDLNETGTTNNGIIRYTSDMQSGIDNGIVTVTVNGSVTACLGGTIADVKNIYNGFDPSGAGVPKVYDGGLTLVSSGISVNSAIGVAPKLNFNVVFNSDITTSGAWFEYSSSISEDTLTDIAQFNFEGSFKGRGPISQRYTNANTLYTNTDIDTILNNAYNDYDLAYALNTNILSDSITRNTLVGEISISKSYDNSPIPPSGLSKWDYNIEITPAIDQFTATPLAAAESNPDNYYYILDMKYATRKIISINGTAQANESTSVGTALGTVKSEINSLANSYVDGTRKYLINANFKTGAFKTISFSATYSCEDDGFTL